MRILIADSGATKTSWAIGSGDEFSIIHTSGMNPSNKTDHELEAVVLEELFPQLLDENFDKLHFYGAGCKAREQSERVEIILKEAFSEAFISVKTDIEAAGLSLFGKEEGIVVISGTGSSAGLMKKGELMDIMDSKAYPEGDYGSGSHIGGLVLQDYFEDKVPQEIKTAIEEHGNESFKERFLLFQDSGTSKQIAAKAMRDVAEFKNSEYLKDKAEISIRLLLEQLNNHFAKGLSQIPVKLIGSTAFYFKEVFRSICSEEGIEIVDIQQNPIEELIKYHLEHL